MDLVAGKKDSQYRAYSNPPVRLWIKSERITIHFSNAQFFVIIIPTCLTIIMDGK